MRRQASSVRASKVPKFTFADEKQRSSSGILAGLNINLGTNETPVTSHLQSRGRLKPGGLTRRELRLKSRKVEIKAVNHCSPNLFLVLSAKRSLQLGLLIQKSTPPPINLPVTPPPPYPFFVPSSVCPVSVCLRELLCTPAAGYKYLFRYS